MSYNLQIRLSTGQCRAITTDGKPLTGWCKSAMNVIFVMRKKTKSASHLIKKTDLPGASLTTRTKS